MADRGKTGDRRGDWGTLPDTEPEPSAGTERPDVIEKAGREWVVNSPKTPEKPENGEDTT